RVSINVKSVSEWNAHVPQSIVAVRPRRTAWQAADGVLSPSPPLRRSADPPIGKHARHSRRLGAGGARAAGAARPLRRDPFGLGRAEIRRQCELDQTGKKLFELARPAGVDAPSNQGGDAADQSLLGRLG